MLTHRIVVYLITLAVGYWVMTLAEKEKNRTKTIGKVIAWIIILVSFFGPLCAVASKWHCNSDPSCSYSAKCPWGDKDGNKPMMEAPAAPNAKPPAGVPVKK